MWNISLSYLEYPFVSILSHFSHVQLFVTSWPVAHQAPLSMGFSRQEHWSGLTFKCFFSVTVETLKIFYFLKLLLNSGLGIDSK